MPRNLAVKAAGPIFVLAGLLHFITPKTYKPAMPDYLPAHDALIALSGVAEIGGGLGLMCPDERVRRWSMWWLIATLVAVFPANGTMALNPERFSDIPGGQATLIARLPFQLVFIRWVWEAGKPTSR